MFKRLIGTSALVLAVAVCAAAGTDGTPLVGTWQGKLPNGMGGEIRVVLKVTQSPEGLVAKMDSPDQNATDIPVKAITLDGQKVTLDVAAVGGSYDGTLDAAKGHVSGTWHQAGQSLPLVFTKDDVKSTTDVPKK